MILSGGDTSTLTLRNFLDAAYALLLEEYTRQNVPLLEAVQQTEHLRARGGIEEVARSRPSTPSTPAAPSAATLADLQRWNQV